MITRNLALFDAEFTARTEKDRGIQEMIQCAFLVYEIQVKDNVLMFISEEPIFDYTTFVKPVYNQCLSEYIKELTGIEQEDVDCGKSFCEAIEDMYNAIKAYDVQKILTWGPDKRVIKGNCNIINCNLFKARTIYNKLDDVSRKISDMCGYNMAISQRKICNQLGVTEVGEHHNAYYDAKNLSKIIKEFCGQYCL